MNLRLAYFLAFLFSLLALAIAAPGGDDDYKPKPSPTPKPKPPVCSKESLCCHDAMDPTSSSAKKLIEPLHISLTAEQEKQKVGLTCSALKKGPYGDDCTFKTLCCEKHFDPGSIAIGCVEASG